MMLERNLGKGKKYSSNLANQHVSVVEVPAEHLGRLAGNRFDLDANFHAFAGRRNILVVALD